MSKQLLIVSLFFCMLFSVSGVSYSEDSAQAKKTKTAGTKKVRATGPVTVTSETLTADNQNHTALFEKNVIAKTSDMTIHADWMLVYYNDPGGDITKIESKGNVKVNTENKVITSDTATYYAAPQERIVFTGSPRAVDGQNVVSGTKITYFVDEERSFVEGGSKIIMKSKQDR